MHGDFDIDVDAVLHRDAGRVEHRGVQHGLGAVDVLDETLDATGEGKVFFLHVALIHQADLDTVIEEGQLPQALGEYVVVILDDPEDFLVRHEMHFRAALFGVAQHF